MKKSSGSMGLLIGILGVAIAGMVSIYLASLKSEQDTTLPVYEQLGQDFLLESTQQPLNSLQAGKGKVILMSFGFTSCPDICPMMLEKYRRIYQALDSDNMSEKVLMYFVTVDPERDTLPVLKTHLASFDERIVGLTGSPAALKELETSVALASQKILGTADFSHSDRIILFDTEGRVRAMPNLHDSVEDLLKNILDLI